MQSLSKPTAEQVEAAVPLLSSPAHERYFFDRLNNPHWIGPLNVRGFFRHPPAPQRTDKGVSHIPWAASRYLARMAPQAPEEVATIFAQMQTDNANVLGDARDAADAMPAEPAASLVPMLCRAIDNGLLWMGRKSVAELCIRLAAEKQPAAALQLADSLFTPTFAPGDDQPQRTERYWYQENLSTVIPSLVAVEPAAFLARICSWLAVSVEAKKGVLKEKGADYSYAWRPAIEEHEENHEFDFAAILVGLVRRAFELAITEKHVQFDDALAHLDKHPWLVFRRLRLHLIGAFAEQLPELARQTMMEKSLFDDYWRKHEYAMLVGRRFTMLRQEEQSAWLAWVDAGPSEEELEGDAEHRRARADYWRFEHLHWIRDYLEGKYAAFYKAMLEQHGIPELADLHVSTRSPQWEDENPMEVRDLVGLSLEQAVCKVVAWKPDPKRWPPHERHQVGTIFGRYVGQQPAEFSKHAAVLIQKPPLFVREFIDQMTQAIEADKPVDVRSLLDVCDWVVAHPFPQSDQKPDWDSDDNWQWTRNTVSRFVKAVSDAKTDGSPRYALSEYRKRLWSILGQLARDPAQSYIVSDITRVDVRLKDFLGSAINSPRGKAVEAALSYARWVGQQSKAQLKGRDVVPGGFDAMPEVRAMLEWQISPENQSVEAGAIIGAYTDLLFWIDSDWVAKSIGRIFDLSPDAADKWNTAAWAAWNAFLFWSRPHIEFYRILRNQFAYAVEQATRIKLTGDSGHEHAMNRLGVHLMVLYGRGQLGLDDEAGQLQRFLLDAAPELGLSAVEYVGWSLARDERVPEPIVRRFMDLWDWFWPKVGKQLVGDHPKGTLFGAWFASKKFPPDWALERLEQFVQVVGVADPEHQVAELLAKVEERHVLQAVRIFDQMIRADREGWRTYGWREEVKGLLARAMAADDLARDAAKQLINLLGRHGYAEFGELLGK